MAAASPPPSLLSPRPKSPPPAYPDLYGKRREMAKVQMLEREIGFLEEEVKYVQGLQPASLTCKEVADFVVANSDPLMPVDRKIRRSRRIWKSLCGASCFNFTWICCFGCTPRLKIPYCCFCNLRNCPSCFNCPIPKYQCCPYGNVIFLNVQNQAFVVALVQKIVAALAVCVTAVVKAL
ncbi:guanine nucleotide-binding protein subunit gamma 3-like [Actinidia eriantha]|uniref:guanine nucleotide-binding protein subunit gamma 3-like n=1 Tax=Actinidia eriantha TaxID=165200 RepID=UPI00258FB8F9|nr:guanine nucleotide-binding protein subunit gamma 3-like [Actinidia eriantha]